MNVRELIEKLMEFDMDMEVVTVGCTEMNRVVDTEVTEVELELQCNPFDQDFDKHVVRIS